MSFTYKALEMSAYDVDPTGSYINSSILFRVSGLAYDGTDLNINKFRLVTGIAIIGSGLTKEVSGTFLWDDTYDGWEANVLVSGAADELATGVVEWNYSGAFNTGFDLTGVKIYANPNEVAWNQITNTNSSVDNADSQHTHGGAATQLQDLDDIARTGSFVYTSGYILMANGYNSYETVAFPDVGSSIDPTGYETVSGGYITHILSSIAHHNPSGYEAISGDYLITSGDYVLLSGAFVGSSFIDATGYEIVSGQWINATGDLSDYKFVSGRYTLTSGSYNNHLTNTTAHHDPSGYETVSGGYITHILSSTAHHDPTGYEIISGQWIAATGDLQDYKFVSGRYVLTSGSYNSHLTNATAHHDPTGYETVSGDYIVHAHALSDLTDVNNELSGTIKSLDDSGLVFTNGLTQGQFFWDAESNYRWDVNAGAWIEIGSSSFVLPTLSGLTDVDLPVVITDGDSLVYSTESGAWTTGISATPLDPSGYETVSGEWVLATGDLSDYKYVSGRYALTSGSYNTHITTLTAHINPSGYETISGDYLITSGTVDDYITLSGDYSTHIGTATAHINPTGYETVSGGYIAHVLDSTAHHDPTGYETVSGGYIAHIVNTSAHHSTTGYETISGQWIAATGDLEDYKYVSGRYALTSGSYNSHIINASAHHSTTGYETVSGGYIAHVVSSTAHHDPSGYETVSGQWVEATGDLSDYKYVSGRYVLTSGYVNSLSLNNLSDVDDDLSGTIISLNDSGLSFTNGLTQGQFFWDAESNYRWDVNAGAWIEIGSSNFVLPSLSGLTDVDLPSAITDNNVLIYSTESGAWTTGLAASPIDTSGYEQVSGDYIVTATGYATHITNVNAHLTNLTGITVRNHNDLQNINAGTDYEHITSAQLGAFVAAATGAHEQSHDNTYHILNYAAESGFQALSGAIDDYAYVSGRYALTSGSYNSHIVSSTVHHNPTGYETVSGDWKGWNYNITGLSGLTHSIVYVDGNGLVVPLGHGTSGLQLTSLGATSAPIWDTAGAAGGDNLGNHEATKILDMNSFQITGLKNPTGTQDAVTKDYMDSHDHDGETLLCAGITDVDGGYWDLTAQYGIDLNIYGEGEYIRIWASSGIPKIGGMGAEDIYFIDTVSNWNTIHADDFTPHSSPMPTELSTDKILLIKNNEDDSCIDYDSIPEDTLYQEPDGANKGYKMNRMMLHLIKTIQELEARIAELEK